MEIRTLRNFLILAEEENMTRAAEKLHITQSALSKQLKALEAEFGQKLFLRRNFRIELTYEGRLLRDRVGDLIDMADKIEKEFSVLDEITGGELFLGLAESYNIRYLARSIYEMKQKYPNLRYHITSGDTEQLIEKLDKGILDFVVLADTPDWQKYDAVAFKETDRWGVIVPAGDPLAQKKKIHVEDLVGKPLFCSKQSWEHEIAGWAGENFEKLSLEGSFRLAYNGVMFVMERLGYLLTFDHLVAVSEETGLVFIPLAPRVETRLYLIWKHNQIFTPIAEKFLLHINDSDSFHKEPEMKL